MAAELEDLALSGVLYPGIDPIRASEAVIKRYHRIWKALKYRQVLDPKYRHAVERAMRQLQDLGFAVDEVSVSLDGESPRNSSSNQSLLHRAITEIDYVN